METLFAITIFAVAMVGMYYAMVSMTNVLSTTMDRNVETAYANMKLSEVNPFDPAVESNYDVTSKTVMTLANGRMIYYTRLVDSATTTPDVKNINLYLYHTSTETSAYRQFKREIAPYQIGFNLGETTAYYRDGLGRVWAPFAIAFSSTSGSRQNGWYTYAYTNYSTASAIAGTLDDTLYQKGNEANNVSNTLGYKFLGNTGREYILTLGFAETGGATTGQRAMTLSINGVSQGSIDAYVLAGNTANKAVVKRYRVTPADAGGGLGVIQVNLVGSSLATPARLAVIGLERVDY